MKAVDQTTFGSPGGNCFSACIASLLEIPLDVVPYFMGDDEWFERLARWLRPHGFYPLCLELSDRWRPAGLHVLSGQSPRDPANPDAQHSVVADGDRIVHDPHPSRAGLVDERDVIVLIPLDPAARRMS